MTRVVNVLRRALDDFEGIHAWIAAKSPAGVDAWYIAYHVAASSLENDAERCGLAPESAMLDYEVRDRFFKTRHGRRYRLLFTIIGDEVRVARPRRGRAATHK